MRLRQSKRINNKTKCNRLYEQYNCVYYLLKKFGEILPAGNECIALVVMRNRRVAYSSYCFV